MADRTYPVLVSPELVADAINKAVAPRVLAVVCNVLSKVPEVKAVVRAFLSTLDAAVTAVVSTPAGSVVTTLKDTSTLGAACVSAERRRRKVSCTLTTSQQVEQAPVMAAVVAQNAAFSRAPKDAAETPYTTRPKELVSTEDDVLAVWAKLGLADGFLEGVTVGLTVEVSTIDIAQISGPAISIV